MPNRPTKFPASTGRRLTGLLLGLAVATAPATAYASPFEPNTPAGTTQYQDQTPYQDQTRYQDQTPYQDQTRYQDQVNAAVGLDDPAKKEIAMQLVSSAENSSLDWKAQYRYIEDIDDGRGYTAGIIGFCSGTGDMLDLVELYTQRKPGNVLAKYLPALREVDGTDSHEGLDPNYPRDWATAAGDSVFKTAQNDERDRVYFNPAVNQGKADQVGVLGQFIYYDAIVMHGDGGDATSFRNIRKRALATAKPPAQGGNETTWLNAFLDARVWAMRQEEAHSDTSRVDTAQRVFLRNGNLNLNTPLDWKVYGDSFHIG